ncbi:sodium-dependent transporter [Marinimicrobium alkaliphilum]|uniref:sodium-dependent transporter n=1 Tax=Marinimicrobium alkaliphilum TaxID=2202654 RepID=UPI000DB9D953|nr:sodium-dependent transporter [Marinimicrobium alkaliphilum]
MKHPQRQHAIWGHRGTFILAATGSAVGLGNIWKFPYVAGENGGGAFVLLYLLGIVLVGVPIMVAEVLMGRRARANPIGAVGAVSAESGRSPLWSAIGWCGVITAFLILSYYSVVAGWTLEYVKAAVTGQFAGQSGEQAGAVFSALLADPYRLVLWQSVFIAMTAIVLAFGVTRGLETTVRVLMPLLFVLLLVMLGYAVQVGDFGAAVRFLFSFNVSDLSWAKASVALGHSFFTLSLAMGAIMAYGSYMPKRASIGKTVFAVAGLDTLVALVAGLAIFPIVFATAGIEPGEGPGLMYISLPVAFGSMPAGVLFGSVFFVLVTLAAWSSTISLLEPLVAYINERFGLARPLATLAIAFAAWLLGLGTVLSFNVWEGQQWLLGRNFFGLLDFFTINVMLPLGGLLMAIFVGWRVLPRYSRLELRQEPAWMYNAWLWALRYLAPPAVLVIMIASIYAELAP